MTAGPGTGRTGAKRRGGGRRGQPFPPAPPPGFKAWRPSRLRGRAWHPRSCRLLRGEQRGRTHARARALPYLPPPRNPAPAAPIGPAPLPPKRVLRRRGPPFPPASVHQTRSATAAAPGAPPEREQRSPTLRPGGVRSASAGRGGEGRAGRKGREARRGGRPRQRALPGGAWSRTSRPALGGSELGGGRGAGEICANSHPPDGKGVGKCRVRPLRTLLRLIRTRWGALHPFSR